MTLIVHPASDLPYASFVLEGMVRALGPEAIRYSTEGFPSRFSGGRVLAFYRENDPSARCFLSFTDQPIVHTPGLRWARVHGAVNIDAQPDRGSAIVAIGPVFGVRLRFTMARRHVASMWRWAGVPRVPLAVARTRAVVRHQRQRAPIDAYRPRTSQPDYVFYTAWPWVKHREVNPPRSRFIEACLRAPGLSFEGGFAPRPRRDVPEVLPLSAPRRYSIREYIAKLGRSAVAFNNPAVHGCLGWKLGEFLALGKAIISLPISQPLPAPLVHGVHLHVVDGSAASIDEALDRLRRDHEYRHTLETNARQWYEEHLVPEALSRRLIQMLNS